MNLTNKLQDTNLTDCWLFLFVSNHFSVLPYTFLVVQLVILIITCPFTIVLNVMVIFAVKKKRRLQTTSNIALACLATTDTIVGIFAYPIIISYEILILQGEISGEVCQLQDAARYLASVALFSSFVHLVLMTAERYIAIKHTLTHHGTITKTRVLIASVVAWIVSAVLQILGIIDRKISITVNNVNTIEVAISTKVRYIIFNSAIFLALVNSLLNPLVYSVRLRQFRVALIEILLNKSQAEAEKFDDRRFGSVIEQIGKRNKDVNRVVNAADIELGTNQAGRQVRTN
ncbi:hypothetical protein pdam_00016614 [Pocillopora damicornis]|uniref:G-protein coupled receptors family 1 profile domain-containing protein n=1 Tax=Pocillopora damicornis TaxID=46731 RepID=A0A3M6T878_POCDA|nr:hypothetical protein pdam_00016614 [Pocillopora damicornis]